MNARAIGSTYKGELLMSYVDGYVLVVPEGKIDAYKEMASKAGDIWMEHGALSYKECVLEHVEPKPDDVPEDFKMRNFKELSGAKSGETVIFAYILYKDRAHRDDVNGKVMSDERMHGLCDPNDMPFDPGKMSWGGFKAIVDL